METNIGELVTRCVEDVPQRFRENAVATTSFQDFALYAFPQMWGNTAGGMGGIGGQALTNYTTVVIVDRLNDQAAVYFGEFAYLVKSPSSEFWEGIERQQMPGVWQEERRAMLSREP